MKIRNLMVTMLVVIAIFVSGCSKSDTFKTITASEANKIMEEEKDVVILDVRTEEEYESGHIKNALLLPLDEINKKAEQMLEKKDITVLVYCRSGRRSALAAQDLVTLGFENVYDFGGILDWPYEIE